MFRKCTSGIKTNCETEFGVRTQDIHHQVTHLLHEIHTQACTRKDKQHRRMQKKGETIR